MRPSLSIFAFTLLSGAAPGALLAQTPATTAPQSNQTDDPDEIIVTGPKERGAVLGDVKPEQQFYASDIRALGVTSVSELVTELSADTNGTPVVLLNGKRISSFSEIQDIPSEAVARVDILPEQVALTYGYAPTQKVVNIVLRQRFRVESAELKGALTTDGGRENGSVEAGMVRIQGDNRLAINLKYRRAAQLLESQRDIETTAPGMPYSITGNIRSATSGAEIDPALSVLAGQSVTGASVPATAAGALPSLFDFVAGANVTSVSDLTRYRTLSPATENFSANAMLARALGRVSVTINGRLELSDSDSLRGLPSLKVNLPGGSFYSPFANDVTLYRYLTQNGALKQNISGTTGQFGVTLNGMVSRGWQWSFTGNGDISDTRTRTDRGISSSAIQSALNAGDSSLNPYSDFSSDLLSDRLTNRASAKSRALSGDLMLSGYLLRLPAGEMTSTIRVGGSANGFESWSIRSGVEQSSDYNREIASGQISLDFPLTSRSKAVLGAVGDIGVNVNAATQRLSDFGTLSTLGYGLRWKPVTAVQILMSANQDRTAPTGSQINDPTITTPNVSVFDYVKGETVFVTRISGGAAMLKESVRDQFRLSATVKPFDQPNLTLTATYLNSRTHNPIASFPTATAAIEAAFPDRFVRDDEGTLAQIDARPINYLHSQNERLRWGFNLSIPVKSRIQKLAEGWRGAGGKPEDRPPKLQSLFGNRNGPGGQSGGQPLGEGGQNRQNERSGGAGVNGLGGGHQGGGRITFRLYHTWHFTESILIASGVPKLDLLNGDATGSTGGQPRHELEARAGYFNNGVGGRLSVDWESGTHVDGALDSSSRLNFGSLATANLRLFANLGQVMPLAKNHPFLQGARVSVRIDNIFNARRDVTDATGTMPLRYQPDYLDPLGRTISVSFRKLFF